MITLLSCIILAISFSVIITYFLIPIGFNLHYFVPIILLIPGFILGFIVILGILFLISLFYSKKKEYQKPSSFAEFVLSDLCRFVTVFGGVKLTIKGRENIPNEKYLLICNHRSNFDPIIYLGFIGKKDFAFISKDSNGQIPMVGRYMRGAHFYNIDREDKLQSLNVIKSAGGNIKDNICSVGVYPEGTRSKKKEMGPFHEGVFQIAKIAKCPVVICSISGSEMIHKNFPFKRSNVVLKILEVMEPVDYLDETSKDISDYAYKLIHDSLDDLSK